MRGLFIILTAVFSFNFSTYLLSDNLLEQIENAWTKSNEMRNLSLIKAKLQESTLLLTTGLATDQEKLITSSLENIATLKNIALDDEITSMEIFKEVHADMVGIDKSANKILEMFNTNTLSKKDLLLLAQKVHDLSFKISEYENLAWGKSILNFRTITTRYETFNEVLSLIGLFVVVLFSFVLLVIRNKNKIEAELHKKDKLKSFLFSSLSEGVIVCNTEGIISSCNLSAAALFGMEPPDMLGMSVNPYFNHLKVFTPNNKIKKNIRRLTDLLNKGVSQYGLNIMIPGQESERWFTCNLQPIKQRDDKSFFMIFSFSDITEQIHNKFLIKEQENKLVESSKSETIAHLAGSIAHEINNPLTILSTSAQMLDLKIKKGKELETSQIEKANNKVLTTTKRIAKIVKGLLALSRNEKDAFNQTHISTIIEMTEDFCQIFFKQGKIKFEKIVPSEDIRLECNPIQISQVLINLIKNASEAIEPLQEKWIKLTVINKENQVILSVSDSGKALTKDDKEKILLPFYTTKEVGSGTGIGLSICKTIIENHEGSLEVNMNSENTDFLIALPKKQSEKSDLILN